MQLYIWNYQSDERAGVALVIALVAASRPGANTLKKAAKRIKRASKRGQQVNAELDENGNTIVDGDNDGGGDSEVIYADTLCEPENMLQMMEMLLAFHAWYKRGYPFSLKTNKEKEEVMNAICIMMWQIKRYAPHQDRNGWHLHKFHDLLHIVCDIENFGSPNNLDAAPNENNLIDPAKKPAWHAQKRKFLCLKSVNG